MLVKFSLISSDWGLKNIFGLLNRCLVPPVWPGTGFSLLIAPSFLTGAGLTVSVSGSRKQQTLHVNIDLKKLDKILKAIYYH